MAKSEKNPSKGPARADRSPAVQEKTEEPLAPADDRAAAQRFVHDLEVRGEALPPSASGLPTAATHAVVEENPDGTAKQVKRVRFKMF